MLQVNLHKADTLAELRDKMFLRRAQHVDGNIGGSDLAIGQCFEQLASKPPPAAAGVKNVLVAAQRDARQHLLAPAHLRARDLVVERRVPFVSQAISRQLSALSFGLRAILGLTECGRLGEPIRFSICNLKSEI